MLRGRFVCCSFAAAEVKGIVGTGIIQMTVILLLVPPPQHTSKCKLIDTSIIQGCIFF